MKQLTLLTMMLVLSFAACFAGNAPLTGKWTGIVNLPDGKSYSVMYQFQTNGDSLGGTALADGNPKPIVQGTIHGNDCSFSIADDDGSLIAHTCTWYAGGDTIAVNILYGGHQLHTTLKRTVDGGEKKLASFQAIKIQGPYIVYIRQGQEASVRVDAPDAIAYRIVTTVKNGVLIIRNRHDNWSLGSGSWYSGKSWWHTHDKVVVNITTPQLTKISTAGSSAVYFNGGLTTGELRLKVLGSGTIVGLVHATTIKTRSAGSAHLQLFGTVHDLYTRIKGSGNVDATRVVSLHAAVNILGSGHAAINATQTINAALYGSSSLDYSGPAQLRSRKVGSASIGKKNS